MKEIISTDKAPAAIGPYSQAVKVGNLLFTSGQIPIDPATNTLVEGGIEVQARRVMENVKAILTASGADMDQTLIRAAELAKGKGDYVIQSTHDTASGRTEITVRRHSPVIWIVLGVVGLIVFLVLRSVVSRRYSDII